MKKLDFFQSLYNSAFYFNGQSTYIAVYVDDLYIIGSDLSLINKLKKQLASKFKTTDLGSTAHYLGIEVFWKKDIITVMQSFYINQLLETHQMSNCNFASILIIEGLCLALAYDNFISNSKNILAYK